MKIYKYSKDVVTKNLHLPFDKREFTTLVLYLEELTYIVNANSFAKSNSYVYFFQEASIKFLQASYVPITVFHNHIYFMNSFVLHLAAQLAEQKIINIYRIKTIGNEQ